jgi:hypothetical protein
VRAAELSRTGTGRQRPADLKLLPCLALSGDQFQELPSQLNDRLRLCRGSCACMSSLSTRCPPSPPRARSPWTASIADSDFRAASYAVTNAAAASSVVARMRAEDRCMRAWARTMRARVRLNTLDLPAVEEEPGGRSVRQPAEAVRERGALSHRLSPGRPG